MPKRVYVADYPDMRWEKGENGLVKMFVCGQEVSEKSCRFFTRRSVVKDFRQEIEQRRDTVCPTMMGAEG